MLITRKKNMFFPILGGKGGSDQTDTSLSGGEDSPKEAIVKISER